MNSSFNANLVYMRSPRARFLNVLFPIPTDLSCNSRATSARRHFILYYSGSSYCPLPICQADPELLSLHFARRHILRRRDILLGLSHRQMRNTENLCVTRRKQSERNNDIKVLNVSSRVTWKLLYNTRNILKIVIKNRYLKKKIIKNYNIKI